MKNLKAILMIILGSFFIATGFAFAGTAENQLNNINSEWNKSGGSPMIASPFTPTVAPAAAPAKVEEPPKKETPGQAIKKWVGDHKVNIAMGALGAYLGYMAVGTLLGAATFGLGFLLVLAIAAA